MVSDGKAGMKFFKRTDLIVITAIMAAGLAIWLVYGLIYGSRAVKAEIYFDNEPVETVSLEKGRERTFSIRQKPEVVFKVDNDGNIGFIESDCPDKICVKTGKLHMVGQSAACLPNGVVLRIVPAEGRSGDEPDIIIGSGGK
ncbi:MAG TPA: NusG domain II-containing protein [Clostridia bacterium]|nr:NusG domain II-containing protein [Clostridia bacterium]